MHHILFITYHIFLKYDIWKGVYLFAYLISHTHVKRHNLYMQKEMTLMRKTQNLYMWKDSTYTHEKTWFIYMESCLIHICEKVRTQLIYAKRDLPIFCQNRLISEKRPIFFFLIWQETYLWKNPIFFFFPVRERTPYLSRNNRFMFVGLLGTRYQTFWICGVLCCLYVCFVCLRL